MPQILIDCERMKFQHTGIHTYCFELGKALQQQTAAAEALCFYMPAGMGRPFGQDARYLRQRSWHKYFMWYRPVFDIWHNTYQTSWYGPRHARTRCVLTIHDLNFVHEGQPAARINRLLRRVQQNIDRADHIVFISRFMQQDVSQRLQLGNKPVQVIYNGADVQAFPEHHSPLYRPQPPFSFSLGTVIPKKNFHVLPCLLQHNQLVMAGTTDPAYRQQIMQEAARHGVTERVKIIGPVTAADKYWYLNNCYAFVFPSLAEGFGIPAIEAMQLGKPVFLSTRTSLPEIGGQLAYYFTSFEPSHMQKIFDKGMAHYSEHNPAAAIKAHARQFNWKNTATAYLDVYRSLY